MQIYLSNSIVIMQTKIETIANATLNEFENLKLQSTCLIVKNGNLRNKMNNSSKIKLSQLNNTFSQC